MYIRPRISIYGVCVMFVCVCVLVCQVCVHVCLCMGVRCASGVCIRACLCVCV